MTSFSPPELLLQEYGIVTPSDIDLEAIAWAQGAKVKYKTMDSCEARIAGLDDKAIITIDNSLGDRRARFSLAHEIAHWQLHRGQVLFCSKENIESARNGIPAKERQADGYAAQLLMPKYMFHSIARSFSKPSFQVIDELANEFNTSRIATALRYINMDIEPYMLICHGPQGREWFRKSGSWPDNWIPKKSLDHNADAFDLIFGHANAQVSRSICSANIYFNGNDADRFDVWTNTVLTGNRASPERKTLTLIIVKSPEMMDARDHWTGGSW